MSSEAHPGRRVDGIYAIGRGARGMVGVIAHRGASEAEPENTVRAIEAAVELGVTGVEIDVRKNADGEPVVIHDATVDRTTDGSGPVADHTVEDLRALDAGKGEPVPTLDEALAALGPGTLAVIELKELGTGGAVLAALAEHDALDRARVISFTPGAVAPLAGAVTTGYVSLEASAATVDRAAGLGASLVGVDHANATREFVRTTRDRGFAVNLWTPDTDTDLRAAIATGADLVTTNRPWRALELVTDGKGTG